MPARQPSIPGTPLTPKAARTSFLVTCEHGGKRIPAPYRSLFEGREGLLSSHRGYDAGALVLARDMADALHAPLVAAAISRLLVDLNRSPSHHARYSEITRTLPAEALAAIHSRYYLPYRRRVEHIVASAIRQGSRVVHISSHSFTPVMDGRMRTADVGFLYDPAREGEVELSHRWMAELHSRDPDLRLRRNYPYTGRADGFCKWLRRHYPAEHYVGIELEVNQRFATGGGAAWGRLRKNVVAALTRAAGIHDAPAATLRPADRASAP